MQMHAIFWALPCTRHKAQTSLDTLPRITHVHEAELAVAKKVKKRRKKAKCKMLTARRACYGRRQKRIVIPDFSYPGRGTWQIYVYNPAQAGDEWGLHSHIHMLLRSCIKSAQGSL